MTNSSSKSDFSYKKFAEIVGIYKEKRISVLLGSLALKYQLLNIDCNSVYTEKTCTSIFAYISLHSTLHNIVILSLLGN